MLKNLFAYFRLKDPTTSAQIDLWLADLSYIDAKTIPWITAKIQEFDNLPRNIPKLIKAIYGQYNRQNLNAYVKYDRYEDLRFPIAKLHTATELLITNGQEAFDKYCRSHYMPTQDIERCQNKANYIKQRQIT